MILRRTLVGLPALMTLPAAMAGGPSLVAFAHALPPLSFEDKGRLTGLAVELLRHMATWMGMSLDLVVQPRVRAERSYLEVPNSLLFPLARLPEREGRFLWIGPFMPRRVSIFKLRSRKELQFRGLEQLGGMRVGVTMGTATHEQLKGAGLMAPQIELAPSYEANVRKLLAGRMEFLAIGDLNLYWQLRLLGESADKVMAVSVLDDEASYCFGMHIDSDPALAQRLQKAFDHLQRSGVLRELKRKYGLEEQV